MNKVRTAGGLIVDLDEPRMNIMTTRVKQPVPHHDGPRRLRRIKKKRLESKT